MTNLGTRRVAGLLLVLGGCGHGDDRPLTSFPNSVAAGDVTQTSAVLWTRADREGPLAFEVSSDPKFRSAATWFTGVVDPMVPARVTVTGLAPGTLYHYRAFARRGFSPAGKFRTLPAASTSPALRFGAGGDWRGDLAPFPAVANAAGRGLDFFVALGDTIYADFPSVAVPAAQAATLAEFRSKHAEVYTPKLGLNALAELRASTAFLATLDDHEITDDFSGGAAPASDPRFAAYPGAYIHETALFLDGLRAFREFHPVADESYGATGDSRTAGKPKLYRSRTFGKTAAAFLLDARTFRDEGLPAVADPTDPGQVGSYLVSSFTPGRTLLGAAQVADLKADLLQAQADGVCWKFVFVPEPIQNLGVVGASDRFEGYAAERTEVLKFIADNGIRNAVFVTADIHGMVVNNLGYQISPADPQVSVESFEIATPAAAYSAPLGPEVAGLGAALGMVSPAEYAAYQAMAPADQDLFVRAILDGQLVPLGYDPVGLEGSSLNATLLEGSYVAAHAYGWSEFEIDATTLALTVTTYGIPWYSEADLAADPAGVAARTPSIVSRFQVQPK